MLFHRPTTSIIALLILSLSSCLKTHENSSPSPRPLPLSRTVQLPLERNQFTPEQATEWLKGKKYKTEKYYIDGVLQEIPQCERDDYFALNEDGTGITVVNTPCNPEQKDIPSTWKIVKESETLWFVGDTAREEIIYADQNGFSIAYYYENQWHAMKFIVLP